MPIFKSAILALFAFGIIWLASSPAQAQSPGCSCPAGAFFSPDVTAPGGGFCITLSPAGFPTQTAPVCRGAAASSGLYLAQAVGHLASNEQQISFSGIQDVLQQKRDILMGLIRVPRGAAPLGYMPANLDDGAPVSLSYASRSSQTNPLADFKALAPSVINGPNWAAWAQGYGDWERESALSVADVTHFTSSYGAQTGVDGTWQGITPQGGVLVAGIVGSFNRSFVNFNGTTTTLRLTGPGIGAYATFVQGNFSTDLTTKYDFLQLDEDFAGTAPSSFLGLINAGASGNVQYVFRFDNGYFVEPTAGFSFTRTIFGTGAAALSLQDASTLRLQGGARWGMTWEMNGLNIEASVKTLVYSNVVAQGTAITANFLGAGIVPTDQGLIRGQINPELTFCLPDNYSATLSGEVRFGQDLTAGSVKLALRKQW